MNKLIAILNDLVCLIFLGFMFFVVFIFTGLMSLTIADKDELR